MPAYFCVLKALLVKKKTKEYKKISKIKIFDEISEKKLFLHFRKKIAVLEQCLLYKKFLYLCITSTSGRR